MLAGSFPVKLQTQTLHRKYIEVYGAWCLKTWPHTVTPKVKVTTSSGLLSPLQNGAAWSPAQHAQVCHASACRQLLRSSTSWLLIVVFKFSTCVSLIDEQVAHNDTRFPCYTPTQTHKHTHKHTRHDCRVNYNAVDDDMGPKLRGNHGTKCEVQQRKPWTKSTYLHFASHKEARIHFKNQVQTHLVAQCGNSVGFIIIHLLKLACWMHLLLATSTPTIPRDPWNIVADRRRQGGLTSLWL